MGIPAVVAAGDRRAAKRIRGESKPYLQMAGRSLVAHVVALLQDVPEVSDLAISKTLLKAATPAGLLSYKLR